jgi:hypothetical protein
MFSARANLPDNATTRAPCSQAQFCKELVKAGQCLEGVDYEPDEENREYYEHLVGEHLLCLPYVRSLLVENMPVLVDEVGDGDLAIESIAYAQLKNVRSVIGIELPIADGTFQTFTAPGIRTTASKTKKPELGVKVVMGPGGGLYEPQTKVQATFAANFVVKNVYARFVSHTAPPVAYERAMGTACTCITAARWTEVHYASK